MLIAFEDRVQMKLSPKEPVVQFLPEYAAYLMSRLEVGKDGKTAYERVKGKAGSVLGLEFGEKLMWKTRMGEKQAKIRARWAYGIFVGVRRKSGEVWVATEDGGIQKVRSVRRIPVEDRWGPDCVGWVRHLPWNRYSGDEQADGDVPEGRSVYVPERDGKERGKSKERTEE